MPRYATTPDNFWQRVDFSGRCWEWQGHIDIGGYGRVSWTSRGIKKSTPAHRAAWEICSGQPVPDGMWVLHRCDNRRCVRPDHLFLGTVLDNNRDMITKGRDHYTGSLHPRAKLTEDDVRAIRKRYKRPGITGKMLAAEYNVSYQCIEAVVARRNWKHVT